LSVGSKDIGGGLRADDEQSVGGKSELSKGSGAMDGLSQAGSNAISTAQLFRKRRNNMSDRIKVELRNLNA